MDAEKSIKNISKVWKFFGWLYIALHLIFFLFSLINKQPAGILIAGPFTKTWLHSAWWMHLLIGITIKKKYKIALKMAYLLSGIYVIAIIASGMLLPYFKFTFLKMLLFVFYGINLIVLDSKALKGQLIKINIKKTITDKLDSAKKYKYLGLTAGLFVLQYLTAIKPYRSIRIIALPAFIGIIIFFLHKKKLI